MINIVTAISFSSFKIDPFSSLSLASQVLPSIAKVNSKFNECGLGKYIDALYVNTRYLIFQRLFPRQECLNTKANYFSKVQYERKHELVSWQTYKQQDRKKNNIIGREYFQISQKHLKTVSPALLYTIDGFISTQIVFFSILVFDSVFPVDW